MTDLPRDNIVSKSIIVELNQARTFQAWTEQIAAWWPAASHSRSGDSQTQVFIEGGVGGRFFERTSQGAELEWGQVLVWEPPHRLVFTWYLGSDPTLPSQVEVQFVALNEAQTRLDLTHRGPELIGELWWQRVAIFNGAWDSILAKFTGFLTADQTD